MTAAPDSPSDYDVVVVGGGAAGVAAAIGAAGTGARTLLVERYGMLGGAATASSVLTYCGFFTQGAPWERVVAGAGELVLAELDRLGGSETVVMPSTGNRIVLLDPEAVKLALDRVLARAGVEVWLHSLTVEADSRADRLRSVTCAGEGQRREVAATAFVDATGHGNLATLAGSATAAPEPGSAYQASTMIIRLGGIDPAAEISSTALAEALRAANAGRATPLPRESGVITRLPLSGDVLAIVADVSCDPFSVTGFSRAERAGRELAWSYLTALRGHLAGAGRAYLVGSGPQLGVREGRRVVGRVRVTGDDVRAGRRRADGVARCGWPMEGHPGVGRTTYEPVGGAGWYHIPLGSLISRTHANLFAAGRIVSCDRAAFTSLRVMGTAFASGHAAGVAAATYAAGHGHDLERVRTELAQQGALI